MELAFKPFQAQFKYIQQIVTHFFFRLTLDFERRVKFIMRKINFFFVIFAFVHINYTDATSKFLNKNKQQKLNEKHGAGSESWEKWKPGGFKTGKSGWLAFRSHFLI